jgi:hypothetical protein
MSRATHLQENFTGGEISPFMLGRIKHEIWNVSALEVTGFVPRPQGPLEACPGFEYIATAPGPCTLIPFEPYVTQSHLIEASAGQFRFYTNDVLLKVAGVPVVLPHPYTYNQVKTLDYNQDNDVLYLWHGDIPPQQLIRLTATSFQMSPFNFANGPFEDRNADKTLLVNVGATTGDTTLTASRAMFLAGDVGGQFEIEFVDLSAYRRWAPSMTVTPGMLVVSINGNVYQHVAGTITGPEAPKHLRGTEYDGIQGNDINAKGPYGCSWTHLFNALGRMNITDYVSPTQVKVSITQQCSSTNTSYRWRFGVFSTRRGWPEHARIIYKRLCVSKGDTRYFSQIGLYNDFDRFNELGDISDDQAIISPMTDPNPIQWLHAGTDLYTGGAAEEGVLRQASTARGVAPGNVRNLIIGKRGSAAVRSIDLEGRPIFVQRSGRKVLRMIDTNFIDRLATEDMTRYADHIGNSRILGIRWQREPLPLMWAYREDGLLVGCLCMPEEALLGWFTRPLGGGLKTRSISSVASPDASREDLWITAETPTGKWFVLKLAPFRYAGEYDENAIMCDAALSYDGPPATILNAVHLAGQTVDVVGDGAALGSFVVAANGDISLPHAVSKAMAGFPFPARWRSLPVEAGGDDGPAMFKQGQTKKLALRVQNSRGLRVQVDNEVNTAIDIENQFTDSPPDEALPFMTQDIVLDMVGAYDRQNIIQIDRMTPQQTTILAIMREVDKASL